MSSPLWLAAALVAAPAVPGRTADPVAAAAEAAPVPLTFGDFLAPGPALEASPRLAALAGRRVRLVGYMVELEEALRGAFYVAARPVRCDEGGAGTGDLPPDAVRVVVRSAAGEEIPYYPGLIEVTGLLETGSQADEEGRPSWFRITLDRPGAMARPSAAAPPSAPNPTAVPSAATGFPRTP
jgi:hypothetical protein